MGMSQESIKSLLHCLQKGVKSTNVSTFLTACTLDLQDPVLYVSCSELTRA